MTHGLVVTAQRRLQKKQIREGKSVIRVNQKGCGIYLVVGESEAREAGAMSL